MEKVKIITVFGTRPEAIKMFPFIKECENHSSVIDLCVCVTGQHKEMLYQILDLVDITPDYDLDIMTPNQDLYDITSRALLSIKSVLQDEQPNMVIVQGDTTSTFAASLAAFYEAIPVGHIEAGLRTGNLRSPFPEEANRILTSHLATLHFAPTKTNFNNLISEGIKTNTISITGNTVIDALLWVKKSVLSSSHSHALYDFFYSRIGDAINSDSIILVTGHRRENFGKGFIDVCTAIKEIALAHEDWNIVYPVHLNPNVQNPVNNILANIKNVHLLDPLDYGPFVYLMDRAKIILTDSGGVQEEAPSLGKPVIVLRDTTERPEAVDAGTVKLVGTDRREIRNEVERLMTDNLYYEKMSKAINPYGDGKAASRILSIILDYFKQ